MLKWPAEITAIRHVKSAYNALERDEILGYKEFSELFDKEYQELTLVKILEGSFPSPQLKALAIQVAPELQAHKSDYDTEIAEGAIETAVKTGQALPGLIDLPNMIYVSPYNRTRKTLQGLIEGWPELGAVKQHEDDRIREQEHGVRTAYTDWRLYLVCNPQYALRNKLETKYEYKHEGGESLLNVRARLRDFIAMLIREHGGISIAGTPQKPERILMVTHHLAIMALRSNLERWSREDFIQNNENDRPPNCSVTVYHGVNNTRMTSPQGRFGRLTLAHKHRILY